MRDDSPVIRERVIVPEDEVVVERVSDTTTPVSAAVVPVAVSTARVPTDAEYRLAGLERAMQLWWLFVGTLCCLIVFRFCLLLFGVNQANAFANLLLTVTQPLVAPFLTMFGSPAAGQAIMELPDFVAVITYLLVGIGVDRLLRVLFAPPDPTGNAYRTTI